MNLIEKIDRMLELPPKGENTTGLVFEQWLQHKKFGAKAQFVKDMGGGQIKVKRESDNKEFVVKKNEWEPEKGKKTSTTLRGRMHYNDEEQEGEEELNERTLSVPDQHRLKIAKDTLKMSDAGAKVMGGMTKEEARKVIKELTGKSVKE